MIDPIEVPKGLMNFYTAECERVHDLLDDLGVPRRGSQTMSQRLEEYVKAQERAEATVARAAARR